MRQAGRYLPEYRAIRSRVSGFMELCSTPELACEVTLQPLNRFDLDAAIIFSDILTIPDAMGLGLHFVEGEGPKFEFPIRHSHQIDRLTVPDPEADLGYVMDAIRLVRGSLGERIPLIGFAGSPWTLASYMIEGQSPGDFRQAKSLLLEAPETLHRLLEVLTQSVTSYLVAQVGAGAQALMIFDTWGGVLSEHTYLGFSLKYIKTIVDNLSNESISQSTPVIVFTKGGGQWLPEIINCGCAGIGLDWTVNLTKARDTVAGRCALQGNMDPCTLYANPECIRQEVARILKAYGPGSGHIFNLGHGIQPQVNPEHVNVLVDAVHQLSLPYHR